MKITYTWPCRAVFFVLLLSPPLSSCAARRTNKNSLAADQGSLDCPIAIIGAGPAGTYLAYRLSVTLHRTGICLFEKEKEVGGRLRDETLLDKQGKEVWVGTGGRRINDTQNISLDLARELDIPLQLPDTRSQLIQIGNKRGFSPDHFKTDFPRIVPQVWDNDPSTNAEDEVYNFIIRPENRAKARVGMSFRAYVEMVAGADAFMFLRNVSRFRGDFDYNLSATNYLEYLEEELKLSGVNLYPVGGMGMFPKTMAARAIGAGVRVFTSEPLLEISEDADQSSYKLKTPSYSVTTKQLVIAAPPAGFDLVQGKLAAEIRAKPEYKALVPIRIVVINQQWPSKWWESARKDTTGNAPWRAWSTDVNHCTQHTEIPQEKYLAEALVTRSVYSEDPKCVELWEKRLKEGGLELVGERARQGLAELFEVAEMPKPSKTTMQVWPGGWYYARTGTSMANADIAKWSIEPLPGRKNLMMAGEAYWGNRPGWTPGAYMSVDNLIANRFR